MMRPPRCAALLLLLWCASVSLATAEHHCGFTEIGKRGSNHPLPVVHEVPRSDAGGRRAHTAATPDKWAPIRILLSTADLYDPKKYCSELLDDRPTFEGTVGQCISRDQFLTPSKRDILLKRSVPRALKLHTDRLLVRPTTGGLKVPTFAKEHYCHPFTVPAAHHNPGIVDYDTVLYVAAGPCPHPGVVAWATSCFVLEDGRPAGGAMNFAPDMISSSSRVVRTAAHEMAHAFGFEFKMFEKYTMLLTKTGVRGKEGSVVWVNSSKVVEKAREHYNCPTTPGMELEDEGGNGTALSHWERRNAKDELMAGVISFGFYTALTMAAFEDLGFYRANWGMEEPMSWGKNSGCDLLTEKCVTDGVTKYPGMFCTELKQTYVCTSDRLGMGTCRLLTYGVALPPQYQYFSDTKKSGDSQQLMDYCPFIVKDDELQCITGDPNSVLSSRFGPDSMCLQGDSLISNGDAVGDICAEIRCVNKSLLVRYRDDNQWYPCPEGGFITPTKTFSSGRIVCPKYDELCTIAFDGSSRIKKPDGTGPTKEPRLNSGGGASPMKEPGLNGGGGTGPTKEPRLNGGGGTGPTKKPGLNGGGGTGPTKKPRLNGGGGTGPTKEPGLNGGGSTGPREGSNVNGGSAPTSHKANASGGDGSAKSKLEEVLQAWVSAGAVKGIGEMESSDDGAAGSISASLALLFAATLTISVP